MTYNAPSPHWGDQPYFEMDTTPGNPLPKKHYIKYLRLGSGDRLDVEEPPPRTGSTSQHLASCLQPGRKCMGYTPYPPFPLTPTARLRLLPVLGGGGLSCACALAAHPIPHPRPIPPHPHATPQAVVRPQAATYCRLLSPAGREARAPRLSLDGWARRRLFFAVTPKSTHTGAEATDEKKCIISACALNTHQLSQEFSGRESHGRWSFLSPVSTASGIAHWF